MDARINRRGFLLVCRAGEFKNQYCPFFGPDNGDNPSFCGDRCPMFFENENQSLELRCGRGMLPLKVTRDERNGSCQNTKD